MTLRVGCRADDPDKHEFDVNFVMYKNGKLYSAADDGKIKAWAPDLAKVAEVKSNPCSVLCLAASDNTLYSCSNEGTIKLFELDTLKEKSTLVRDEKTEFWKLAFANNCLYSGDNEGNIKVWKNNNFYSSFNISEPVKDFVVHKNLLFTVKDVDLVITDCKLDGEKIQFGLKHTFPGRAPVTLIGDKYFAFSTREGRDIVVHENSSDSRFKEVLKIQGAHEKIINALVGAKWNEKYILFSGGWDKVIKKWVIEDGKAKLDSSCDVEIVVNAITLGDKGEIYVGGSDGHIVRLEVE